MPKDSRERVGSLSRIGHRKPSDTRMIEYVFRPSRLDKATGKRVRLDYYAGRYALAKGGRIFTVALETPDREIARKRLRQIVLTKQREQEGLIPQASIREAASTPLPLLVNEYEADENGRELDPKHIKDTLYRIRRTISETGWRSVGDVRPDSFVRWRTTLGCSTKTKKEYQTSICAFLNWLVKTDRIERNPLAKIDPIEIRGKQVRESRAFTEDELRRLFAAAGSHLPAYMLLFYTGQRREEVRSLVWGDLHLDGEKPSVLFRASTTKDKDKRAVPLSRTFAVFLRELRPVDATPSTRVFNRTFPVYDSLRVDFKRAGIEHADGLGRVVHFHSFRKTWQTFGVQHGINQRAAQEILGHSDANLTARVYTDVPALGLHEEIEKLPWFLGPKIYAQPDAQKRGANGLLASFAGIIAKFVEITKDTATEQLSHLLASHGTPGQPIEMGAGAGFEPATFRL